MNREDLAKRGNWQGKASRTGESAETVFQATFSGYLDKNKYKIEAHPRDLKNIYSENHGIEPDFSILNVDTNKKIFVELKRQGAEGNAHERACKYLAPGIINAGREKGDTNEEDFPFWIIFSGKLASDAKRKEEITFWFKGIEGNVFLWENLREYDAIHKHFEDHIRPILEN